MVVSMVALLVPRALVLDLSCSRESFTRRRRRESSARRLGVSGAAVWGAGKRSRLAAWAGDEGAGRPLLF